MMERLSWLLLTWAVRRWATLYLDQWEMFRLETEYGPVFVRIAFEDTHPELYDRIN